MSMSNSGNIWWWAEPEIRWKEDVFRFIKSSEPNKDILMLSCMDIKGFDETMPLTNYIFQVCQNLKLIESNVTFLSSKDHLLAIELCLARSKVMKDFSNLEVSDKDIVNCHNAYINNEVIPESYSPFTSVAYEKFLEESNCIDLWSMSHLFKKYFAKQNGDEQEYIDNFLTGYKVLILGFPQAQIFKEFILLLARNQEIHKITVETALDISLQASPSSPSSSPKIEVYSQPIINEDIEVNPLSTNLESATKEYVEEIMLAFLSLLVNSRNELALSRAMISPIISLSHSAFTELKHLANETSAPMCQKMISYVRKIRLGGKGYAPDKNCPLFPHLKSLEKFVDFLNKLQTVVEENADVNSAIKQLITIIKKKILASTENDFKESHVQSAAENLKETAFKVSKLKHLNNSDDTPQIGKQTLDVISHLINYRSSSSWIVDPENILQRKYSKRTPLNVPPLLGYFRSPEEESSSVDAHSELEENSKLKFEPEVVESYFHRSESTPASCLDSVTPTKTSFKDCLLEKKHTGEKDETSSQKSIKGYKRAILGEITNEMPKRANQTDEQNSKQNTASSKRENDNMKKKPKMEKTRCNPRKPSKKNRLIEGQSRITTFFVR